MVDSGFGANSPGLWAEYRVEWGRRNKTDEVL